jgi:outer membrane protein insertion porin family
MNSTRYVFDTDIKHTTLKTNDCYDNDSYDYFAYFQQNIIGNCNYTSREIRQFKREEGTKFWTFGQAVSWSHDTLNRALFPNKGGQQRLVWSDYDTGSDLEYYKVGYRHQHYFPLAKDFTFKLNGEIAYGGSYGNTHGLPFFEKLFYGWYGVGTRL